jgi:hypothetical protein
MRISLILLSAAFLWAASKSPIGPVTTQAGNDKLAITATVYCTKDEVKEQLGSDLGGYFIVVKVDLTPKGKLAVSPDDFLLRSYKDGQKSQPFAPSQIAGRAALVVRSTGNGGSVAADAGGPVWGPGLGGPMWFPGSGGVSGGSATSDTSSAEAKIDTNANAKEDPLLAVLKAKILPDKQTAEPLSGLLYFSLEGKYKAKDLVLQYNGPAGKLQLEFKP